MFFRKKAKKVKSNSSSKSSSSQSSSQTGDQKSTQGRITLAKSFRSIRLSSKKRKRSSLKKLGKNEKIKAYSKNKIKLSKKLSKVDLPTTDIPPRNEMQTNELPKSINEIKKENDLNEIVKGQFKSNELKLGGNLIEIDQLVGRLNRLERSNEMLTNNLKVLSDKSPPPFDSIIPNSILSEINSASDTLEIVPFNSLNQNLFNKTKFKRKKSSDPLISKLSRTSNSSSDPEANSFLKKKSKTLRDCRICLQSIEDDTNAVQPCACIGSQKFVHKNCLHEWIRIRGLNRCDVCNHEYTGLDLTKKHKNILDWISSNPLIFAYLISGFLTAFFFVYILLIGYLEYRTSNGFVSNHMRYFLLVISIFYTVLFAFIFGLLIIKGILVYLRWRQENYTVLIGPLANRILMDSTLTMNSLTNRSITQLPKNVKQSNDLKTKSIFASSLPPNSLQELMV